MFESLYFEPQGSIKLNGGINKIKICVGKYPYCVLGPDLF